VRTAAFFIFAFAAALLGACTTTDTGQRSRLFVDPPRDPAHPAEMVVLHVPTGGVHVNGVAYLASGRGPHPTVLLFHGLPGNEKNLDLAQAIRRAGWNVVTVNYRGSWGSAGTFRFAHTVEDARAALAYLRAPAQASRLRVDATRIVIAGHSMGGWAAALAAPQEKPLGVVLISAADMGGGAAVARDELIAGMTENMETLAGTSAAEMADELIANSAAFAMTTAAAGLRDTPLLALTSEDGLAPDSLRLVEAIRAGGGQRVTHVHVPTDHAWSDRRIQLSVEIVDWLERLRER
jgi:pimeloyl-ACP methyl ester carboxylesterase